MECEWRAYRKMMQDEKNFQRNAEIWAKMAPKEAVMLPYVNCNALLFCETEKGELNLKTEEKGKTFYYHSQKGAVKEAKDWFKSQNLASVHALYVYGVGLGYYYDAAKAWLKKNPKNYLVFLEDNLAVIHRLFETDKGAEILQDGQVQLIYFRDLKDEEAAFEVLYWNFAMSRICVSALNSYSKSKADFFVQLCHKITYDAAVKNALVDEYQRFGGAFFVNFYQNMLCLADSYLGNQFFGKFARVPAIICGAGPSLGKNISLLGKLLDKAVVFAGGSALNALNALSIQPHFGAGIDPNPMQLDRLSKNQGYEVPFFYRNRMYHDAFKLIHGPRLYITGTGGYDISEWFEEKFKISAEFLDEGHNVVNFCLEIANQMGCNPIIFVGMDLAFTGMEAYASGIVEKTEVSNTELFNAEDHEERALLKTDIYGKPLYTLWKWVAEAEWIGDFAKSHPLLTIINCTEGGLGFPGVPNTSLAEAANLYLKKSYELRNRVHGETQNSLMPQVTYPKIVRLMKELKKSLKATVDNFNILINDCQEMIKKMKEKGNSIEQLQSGRAALAETELEEEPGYKNIVDIFNAVISRILSRDLHEINTKKQSIRQKTLQKIELNRKKLTFLRDVAQVNIELIDFAFKRRKEKNEVLEAPIKSLKTLKKTKNAIELNVDFNPVLVPRKGQLKEGQILEKGCVLRVFYKNDGALETAYVEKDGLFHGQYLLFYPSGSVKEEVFYEKGQLHGPSSFWSEEGVLLAKSLYVKGKEEGECFWYYPSGVIYSIQRFQRGLWHGLQEYYYEDGTAKTLVKYSKGNLVEEAILYHPDGSLFKRIK